jgi:adenylyltransferase and sulfurtransferase
METAVPGNENAAPAPLFVVCRRGNDSQRAVALLRQEVGLSVAVDVVGGTEGWAREVDPGFPLY